MSPEAPRELLQAAASPPKASQQLRDCSHLVALLADQLEALEQQDFARVRELDTLRLRLVEEMQGHAGEETPILGWMTGQMHDALSQVESWMELDQSTRNQLTQLQDDSLPLVRGIDRRSGSGNYLSLNAASTRLDLRL